MLLRTSLTWVFINWRSNWESDDCDVQVCLPDGGSSLDGADRILYGRIQMVGTDLCQERPVL
jgi:hypothetical protein